MVVTQLEEICRMSVMNCAWINKNLSSPDLFDDVYNRKNYSL
jgi:hypothetical protein